MHCMDAHIMVLNSYCCSGHGAIFKIHIRDFNFPDKRWAQKQNFNAGCLSYCQQVLADTILIIATVYPLEWPQGWPAADFVSHHNSALNFQSFIFTI